MSDLIDLSSLPPPQVVQQLAFEAILLEKLQTFIGIAPTFTTLVESDPAIKLLEADAYDEMLLRQRINDAARARLLAFATGSDLDQLAAFYGVTRLTGELDTPFKARVRAAIMGRSAAGTKAQYKFAALSASVDVADVNVGSPIGGVVRVSVLSRIGDGTPTQELMEQVTAVINQDDVRALCHNIQVVPAELVEFDVIGQVWLTPTAPETVFAALPSRLEAAHAAQVGLGFNIPQSWLMKTLQVSGVQRIELSSPSAQVNVLDYQRAVIRDIDLVLAGRDY